jgi:hypothetical protein
MEGRTKGRNRRGNEDLDVAADAALLSRAFPERDLLVGSKRATFTAACQSQNKTDLYRPRGLLYVKMPKAASTTGAGIALRMARTLDLKDPRGCVSFHHGTALLANYKDRDVEFSFLWSTIREPVARVVSEILHFQTPHILKLVGPGNLTEVRRKKISLFVTQHLTGEHTTHQLQYLKLKDEKRTLKNVTRWMMEEVTRVLHSYVLAHSHTPYLACYSSTVFWC